MLTVYASAGPQWGYIAHVLNSIKRSVTPAFVERKFESLLKQRDPRAVHAKQQANGTRKNNTDQFMSSKHSAVFGRKRRRTSKAEVYEMETGDRRDRPGSRTRSTAPPSPEPVYSLKLPTLPPQAAAKAVHSALSSGGSSATGTDDSLTVSSDGRNPLGESTCRICLTNAHEEDILLCDGCGADYHKRCLRPPLATVPPDVWYCPACDVVRGLLGPAGLQGVQLQPTIGDPGSSFNRMQRALQRMASSS